MRSSLSITLASALAACHDPPGMLVEVSTRGVDHIDHVELFVSTTSCGAGCPTITPPTIGQTAKTFSGTGWIVDDNVPYTVRTATGPVARFLLESNTHADLAVARILAVGFGPDGAANGVAVFGPVTVPFATSVVAKVELAPASALGSLMDGEHVYAWPRRVSTERTSCVFVQHPGVKGEFFVPSEDFDCDDVTARPECAPFAYLGASPPTKLADATCVTIDPSTRCVLGGPLCSEVPVAPNPTSCYALAPPSPTYCLPGEMCAPIAAPPCNSYDAACLGPIALDGIPRMPHIECTVITTLNGTACPGMGTMDVSDLVFDTNNKCDTLRIGPIASPPMFSSTVTHGGTATFTLSNFQNDGCTADILWSGSLTNITLSLGRVVGVAEVVTDSGGHRVVPIHVSVQLPPPNDCNGVTTAITCVGVQGDPADALYLCK